MTLAGVKMPDLSRTARRLVYAAWGLLAVGVIGVVLTSSDGSSPGPTILFVTAGLVAALGAVCAGRAIDAGTVRSRLLWVGRALALVGAAVTIVFPAVLYQEIAMLASQGRQPTYDIEAAMWHEFQLMPLVVVPAFVALRWARLGAALFVLDGVFQAIDLLIQPAFITAALLLFGSSATTNIGRATPRLARGAH